MSKFRYWFAVLTVTGLLFGLNPAISSAQTIEELQAQIKLLTEQVQRLQTQLGTSTSYQTKTILPPVVCHAFNVNLRVGDRGPEVTALKAALAKDGFAIPPSPTVGILDVFDEGVASAVVGFQEKYRDEILTPNGLSHGTGFVGASTRAKLNALYPCPTPPPYPGALRVTSPNGGESYPKIGGKFVPISWVVPPQLAQVVGPMANYASIALTSYAPPCPPRIPEQPCPLYALFSYSIANRAPNNGYYQWEIPANIPAGSYVIEIRDLTLNQTDQSDSYFTIYESRADALIVASPNGGETFRIGDEIYVAWKSNLSSLYRANIYLSYQPFCSKGEACQYVPPRLIGNLKNEAGSYKWQIPSDFKPVYPDTYVIDIVLVDANGNSVAKDASDSYFKIHLTTGNLPPVISGVSGPTTLNIGQQGTWTVTARDPENGTLSYSVIWGDEPVIECFTYPCTKRIVPVQNTATFTHVYNNGGVFYPTFTVRDNGGQSAQTSMSVNVGGVISTAPNIYSVTSPVSFGGKMAINGRGLNGVNGFSTVYIDNSVVDPKIVDGSKDGTVLFFSLPSLINGRHQLFAKNEGGSSNIVWFDVVNTINAPSITSIYPTSGATGSKVVVFGKGFRQGAVVNIAFGSTEAGYVSPDGTELAFTVPSNTAPGGYKVTVKNNDGSPESNPVLFTVTAITQQPSITVQFPNGGETIATGATVNVRWTKNFTTSNVTHIDLIGSSGYRVAIAQDLPGDGSSYRPGSISSRSWTVPTNLPLDTYRVQVTVCPETGPPDFSCYDQSEGLFQVISSTGGSFAKLTSPTLNEIWRRGTTHTIKWTLRPLANPSVIHLDLVGVSPTTYFGQIVGNLPGTQTSYAWTLPLPGDGSIPAGTYRVRTALCPKDYYAAAAGQNCINESPIFTIGEPTTQGQLDLLSQIAGALASISQSLNDLP